MLPSSRRKLFRVSITDQLRAAFSPGASVGPGMRDDAFFRTYGNRVANVSAPQDHPTFRDYGAELPVSITDKAIDPSITTSLHIPFVLVGGANTRRSVVSPPIFGPAIIASVWARFFDAIGSGNNVFSLLVSEFPDATDGARPSGSDVFENSLLSTGVSPMADSHGLLIPQQSEPLIIDRPLGERVNLARFFIKPSLVCLAITANAPSVIGMLRVLITGPDVLMNGSRAVRRIPTFESLGP